MCAIIGAYWLGVPFAYLRVPSSSQTHCHTAMQCPGHLPINWCEWNKERFQPRARDYCYETDLGEASLS